MLLLVCQRENPLVLCAATGELEQCNLAFDAAKEPPMSTQPWVALLFSLYRQQQASLGCLRAQQQRLAAGPCVAQRAALALTSSSTPAYGAGASGVGSPVPEED